MFHETGDGRVVNALFAGNSAGGRGAALYLASPGGMTLLHNTIAGPTPTGAAAVYVWLGAVGLTNTIITSHTVAISRTAGSVYEDYNLFFGVPTPTAGGVTSGGHSFTANPAFINPAQADYHLRAGSPAIDAGLNAGLAVDVDGDPRPQDAGFDIGYDEFALRLLYLPLVRR